VDVNKFLNSIEVALCELLSKTETIRFQEPNNVLIITGFANDDFFWLVTAASSANIKTEVGRLFMVASNECLNAEDIFLRFELADSCVDQRLITFIEELAFLKAKENKNDQSTQMTSVDLVKSFRAFF
jgi:hypothetical protein